ncbi:hypothetical protein MXB_4122 [Myxobolus squamalis]|nr:hypothetical protein MXB_4122 [Myxobolus squamalis]
MIPAFQTCFSCEWIPCEFANHRYETPMLFYSHVRSHATWSSEFKHKKVVEYACCWKDIIRGKRELQFGDKNFFNEHVQLHERPFKCTLCEYSCGIKSNLKRHITFRHSDSRSFNCTLCDKSYKSSNDLSRHVKSHINTEPLKCKKEKKQYGCHICKSTFARGYNVTRHLVDLHSIKNSLNVKSMFEKNEDGIYYLSEQFR